MSNLPQKPSALLRQPVIFFGHGSPMNAIEHNRFTRQWQQQLTDLTGARTPKAVFVISAHWYAAGVKITAQAKPPTIHDFSGFPAALAQFHYPAPGAPALAHRIQALLAPITVQMDERWGYDHGCWSVLSHALPHANIPLLQLSLDGRQGADWHLALGEKLAQLRDEGVLIIGSGNVVHNLRLLDWQNPTPPVWASRFATAVKSALIARNFTALTNYQTICHDAELAVPHPDHYLPLLYVLGASHADDPMSLFNDEVLYGSLSMLSVRFGG